jgi:hypothetical protein
MILAHITTPIHGVVRLSAPGHADMWLTLPRGGNARDRRRVRRMVARTMERWAATDWSAVVGRPVLVEVVR